MKKQIGVILLFTLFLLSVPMFVNASSLVIHEEPIYSKSAKKDEESSNRIITGEDIDLSFLAENNMVLSKEQYLEKWNKHNPDYEVSNVKIAGDNKEVESNRASPNVVIGPDGRTKISNILLTPYRQTVYLESIYLNTSNELVVYRCSGSFFRDNLAQGKVLTSAHCIYNREMDENLVSEGYALGMAVYRGMEDGVYDEVTNASSFKIPSEYVSNGQIVNDIGVVTMEDDLSTGIGTLDLESASSKTVRIGGYPADKSNYNQYIMSGSANLSNRVLDYTIDTYGGQSGAPILDNDNKVIGVHSSGSESAQRNYGTALDPIKITFLKQ